MEYLEIIEKNLPEILNKIKDDINNDETISEFIKDKNELKKLIKIQEELITKYLKDFNINELNEETCRQFYKDLKIPYTIVFRSLNTLKKELMLVMNNSGMTKEEIYGFSLYFNDFIDLTAKVYLKKDIHELKKVVNSPFSKYLLFNAHVKWVEDIVKCTLEENMYDFPLINAKECVFSKYLFYPESLMVCIDKNLCMYLYDLHELIHKTANSFYLFYIKGKFSEAYFVFKDLKEQVLKFTKIISELYFVTYSDLENSFFKLIELLEHDEDIYITMVDLKGIKNLNAIYGETVITKALKKLEENIKNLIKNDQHRSIVIDAVTSNFYILNTKYTKDEFLRFVLLLKEIIKKEIAVDNVKINFTAVIASVLIKKYSDYKEFEFIKVLNHIKKEAKNNMQDILIYDSSEQIKMVDDIINERYNEKFILEKLHKQEVDVAFQPIYHTKNSGLFTLEVLGRIIDNKKLIPAGIFIDKIYDMHMIEKFDMLILDKIMQKQELIKKVSKSLFINVSFQSLLNKRYMEKLRMLLKELDINIILELTEQKFVDNIDLVKNIHKKYNVYFAVDDFGSGYSSLKTVLDLVREGILKYLKIDGTLINNIENDEFMKKIVRIISALGNELSLKTVAEYVESKKVLEMMKEYKIDYAQGYYLSKPKTIEELIAIKAGVGEF